MFDENVPGIKEFFKGRDIFITGGTGKYLFCFIDIFERGKMVNNFVFLCRFYGKSVD